MVGQRLSPKADSKQLRKVRKPVIEKKRRDRINNSLAQLKVLLTQSSKQNGSAISRLDKADILEMTVRYLTQCQQQQQQAQSKETTGYSKGFKECTRETMRYLRVSEAFCNDRLCTLNSYLFGVYMAKTEANPSTGVQSIPSVQKIINGSVKAGQSSRPSSGVKTADIGQVMAEDLKRNRNQTAVGVAAIVNDEPIWRPW